MPAPIPETQIPMFNPETQRSPQVCIHEHGSHAWPWTLCCIHAAISIHLEKGVKVS